MRLELGCGKRPTPGYIHHDRIAHSPHIDVAHNLDSLPWPWESESISEILAMDVMEHLKTDVNLWLDECHRILIPDGKLILRVPSYNNPVSYRDTTHQRVFHEESFYFWDCDHPLWDWYGQFYYAESGRWWTVEDVRRVNPDNRYKIGDLRFVMRKR
jgi:predicted SAM-dependent methyltransferase